MRLEKNVRILAEFKEYYERKKKDELPKIPLGKVLDYTKKILSEMKTLLIYEDLGIEQWH